MLSARRLSLTGILLLCLAVSSGRPSPAETWEWRVYGADGASSKYAPLDRITRENVSELRVLWRWRSPEEEVLAAHPELWSWAYEATPVIAGGVLYASTSLSQVAAIDARSGRTIWSYDPESWKHDSPSKWFIHRGVALWKGDRGERSVFIATGDARLIAIDARSGKPIESFGEEGQIDLAAGLRRGANRRDIYTSSSPPTVCRGVVVVGSSMSDFEPSTTMPVGDVRGYDARSGRLLWTFHAVPEEGEPGVETWEDESWRTAGNTNVWTTASCDEELGYVYLPFGTPTNDFYGGHRPGDNLYGEAVVALAAATGERVWHYQVVRHGLWDYDLPAAPNLVDITVQGRQVPALAQVTKQGFVFVLDRRTGEPVWPIEDRPVEPSSAPGERAAPTQPIPTRPAAFDRQGVTREDLIDFTPALKEQARTILETYRYGALYTPPATDRFTLVLPGWAGGASWAGAAFDPQTETLYVTSITSPTAVKLVRPDPEVSDMDWIGNVTAVEGPEGLPLFKPPYGRVTAIDLSNGATRWVAPVGEGPRRHPLLAGLDLPRLGWPRRSFPLLTRTLLFVGQEGVRSSQRTPQGDVAGLESENVDPSLEVFDPATGERLAEIPLPGNATGAPMTYLLGGRQYIVVPIGGASQPAELVAVGLPAS